MLLSTAQKSAESKTSTSPGRTLKFEIDSCKEYKDSDRVQVKLFPAETIVKPTNINIIPTYPILSNFSLKKNIANNTVNTISPFTKTEAFEAKACLTPKKYKAGAIT